MATYRLFAAASPDTNATPEDIGYTLGVEFTVSQNCWVREIHFWQASANSPSTATRTAALYSTATGTTGTLLASKSLSVSGSGWQTAVLDSQVAVVSGTVYRAAILHPAGRYTSVGAYFSTGAGSSGVTNGPLTAPSNANALSNHQGSYLASGTLGFPNASFNSANYWTDVTVSDVEVDVVPESVRNASALGRMLWLARGRGM